MVTVAQKQFRVRDSLAPMMQLQSHGEEETRQRFLRDFHRGMTQEERRCLLLADKYWSGYLLGIGKLQQHSKPISKTRSRF